MTATQLHVAGPYAEAAYGYIKLGYSPIPVIGKDSPVAGFSGYRGRYVTSRNVDDLIRGHGGKNVALRLHPDLVGVDVDAYAGGLETLAGIELEWGALPATVMSTARDDGSGIRMLRKPNGWYLKGALGDGIQICQDIHRYVMSASSIHPKLHLPYRWLDSETGGEADLIAAGELPPMPWRWLEQFRIVKQPGADPVTPQRVQEFIAAHLDATFPAALKGPAGKLAEVTVGRRHDALLEMACWVLREAAAGLYTAEDAVTMLARWWHKVQDDNPERRDGPEFGSILAWAIAQVDADPERVQAIRERTSGVSTFVPIAGPDPCVDGGQADNTDADDLGVAPDGYRLTDVGNASRLIHAADGKLRYVHAWGKWLVYRRGRWVVDENDALVTEHGKQVAKALLRLAVTIVDKDERKAVWAWAIRSETAGSIAAMVRLARGAPGILVQHEDLDADPYLLNVRNGTIDLRTAVLRPHDPADLMTMQAPVAYRPDATSALWEACVDRWQPDPEVRRYVQLRAGAAATGRPTETVDVDYGAGGNGKSKFWGAIQHVLGDYTTVPHKSLLVAQRHEQHATVVANLFRKRLAVASETKAADALDDEQVKNLTGGDRLSGRRMREDPWEFEPTHTLVMFSNHKPKVKGRDEGIWRRLRLVPWEVTIPEDERDDDLAGKLKAEAPGILRWVVDGAHQFVNDGIKIPDAVRAATDRYRNDEDIVGRFVADVLVIGESWARSADIKSELERWCGEQGLAIPDMQEVTPVLESAGCRRDRRTIDGRKTVIWVGVMVLGANDRDPSEQARQ